MTSSLERRRALLTAALGFMQLDRWNEPRPPAMTTLARWMDSWPGIGAVVAGMARDVLRAHSTGVSAMLPR